MQRSVLPEILDDLPASDSRAQRSRQDLRRINWLMGNERWICKTVGNLGPKGASLAEIGAGEGELLSNLARGGRECYGYDFAPRPSALSPEIHWNQGDLFKNLPASRARIVVGSLILHHFKEDTLLKLGKMLSDRDLLIFAEPLRARLPLWEGYLLYPFVNDVTRHDMMVSIRAGFRRGELAEKLQLGPEWTWSESVTLRGGLRSIAVRRHEIV